MTYDIGVVGLGVMGASLGLNIAERGFGVAGFELDPARAQAFVARGTPAMRLAAASSPADLVTLLDRPRRILMMVPAGAPVDAAIAAFAPLLEPDDILIDGGNSHFADTDRRARELETRGVHYVGMGVSGGEEGARHGPSLMPGGRRDAWQALRPILTAIAARAADGEPCVEYMGGGGAGHYVKMVHNAIEYADMQLIAEIYDILHRAAGIPAAELAAMFREWNEAELRSYLIEITADILAHVDPETGRPIVEVVLDEAAQKGTGKWSSQNALDLGAPVPTINAAVEARILSSLKPERVAAEAVLQGPSASYGGSRQELVAAARDALYAAKITSYAQGFGLLRTASAEYGYDLQPVDIAKIWRAGCIIRAELLGDIMAAYRRDPSLVNLLLDRTFRDAVVRRQSSWRFLVRTAVDLGIPVLALGDALGYFDAYRTARLPANLTQAQRDYFGAHTYRRVDRPGTFHTDWQAER